MDLLYILGNGSRFNNDELRYSLRTVERYVKGGGRVIIVGEDPNFLSDKAEYHHIPEATGNKQFKIASKILTACKRGIVKGDFLFMNDDFFFNQDVIAKEYPYYHKGILKRRVPCRMYQTALTDTFKYLSDFECEVKHFDIHTPIIYNAEKFIDLEPYFEESRKSKQGFVVKSLYANIYEIEGEIAKDAKMNQLKSESDFNRIKINNVFSCSDSGWEFGVSDYLKKEYPNKSKYEL